VAFSSTVVLSVASSIGSLARAKDVLLDIKSPVPAVGRQNGIAIGDWNGDGIVDLAIGAPYDPTAASDAGSVRIHSGKDGSVLATIYGAAADEYFGWSVARMPDLDGDGLDDLAVGALGTQVSATSSGSVYLYSGRTGALQRRIDNPSSGSSFGYLIGPMGDVDGDGIADLYVSHYSGEVGVHSGADGHEITKITGSEVEYFGYAVCAVDDLDGDGVRDLLIGAKHHVNTQGYVVGAAYVCSGATGAILRTHEGTWNDLYLGYDTAALADLDGDGVNDYAISVDFDVLLNSAAVYLFSGATGAQIAELTPPVTPWDYFLTQVVAAGDVNGDGVGDVAIEGSWIDVNGQSGGAVYLFSGKTLLGLDRIEVPDLLLHIAPFGDLNGDGRDDLVVGGVAASLDGEVFVFAGDDFWLNATPTSARAFDTVEFDSREGPTGNLTALVLEAIDGIPTFQIVGGVRKLGSLGGNKQFITVPPGLAGHDFTFRAYANDASGRVIASTTQVLSCR
jgi:hypothetical protein